MDRSVIRKPPVVIDGSCLDAVPDAAAAGPSPVAEPVRRRSRALHVDGQWFTSPAHLASAARTHCPLAGHAQTVNGGVDNAASLVPAAADASYDELLRTYSQLYFPRTLMLADVSMDSGLAVTPSAAAARPTSNHDVTAGSSRPTSGRRRSRTSAAGAGRRSRTGSTRSSSSSASNGSLDRIYFTSNDVTTDLLGSPRSTTTLVSCPYEVEVSRLRLEQLRVDEQRILERKRQSELERIRGPQPKWYEMRSGGFHAEFRRNDELLRQRPNWQALLDYRTELEGASERYHCSTSTSRPSTGMTSHDELPRDHQHDGVLDTGS